MVLLLFLIVLLLRELSAADKPGAPQKLGIFSYIEDKSSDEK